MEHQIPQVAIIRDILSTHTMRTQYGSDLLHSFSNVLNQFSVPEGTTAARIALKGEGRDHQPAKGSLQPYSQKLRYRAIRSTNTCPSTVW